MVASPMAGRSYQRRERSSRIAHYRMSVPSWECERMPIASTMSRE